MQRSFLKIFILLSKIVWSVKTMGKSLPVPNKQRGAGGARTSSPGKYYRYIFRILWTDWCHPGSLRLAKVGVFTPRKSGNNTNQPPSPPSPLSNNTAGGLEISGKTDCLIILKRIWIEISCYHLFALILYFSFPALCWIDKVFYKTLFLLLV